MVAPEWVVQQPHSAREQGATNRTHGIFKGRHFEAALIVQAVSWYLRYPLSYRDIEELFLEHGRIGDPTSPTPALQYETWPASAGFFVRRCFPCASKGRPQADHVRLTYR